MVSDRKVFTLVMRDQGRTSPAAYRRLAGLLRVALRRFQFRALSVEEAEGGPTAGSEVPDACTGRVGVLKGMPGKVDE
jgi:hypothetical protein